MSRPEPRSGQIQHQHGGAGFAHHRNCVRSQWSAHHSLTKPFMSKNPHGLAFFSPTSRVELPAFPACQPCSSSSMSLSPNHQRPVVPALDTRIPIRFPRKAPCSDQPKSSRGVVSCVQAVEKFLDMVETDLLDRSKSLRSNPLEISTGYLPSCPPIGLGSGTFCKKNGSEMLTSHDGRSLGWPLESTSPRTKLPGSINRYVEPYASTNDGVV